MTLSCGRVLLIVILALGVGLTGCKSHPTTQVIPPDGPGSETPVDRGDSGRLPEFNSQVVDFVSFEGLGKVYFDYNSSILRPDAVAAIKANAARIKEALPCMVRVEGHCDERGTQEYNLALGERRALAVRQTLIQFGVPADKIVTLSYGKEKPAKEGHTEEAWKLNRRCEFSKGLMK